MAVGALAMRPNGFAALRRASIVIGHWRTYSKHAQTRQNQPKMDDFP